MTAGPIPADEGSDRLTADRLALIGRWSETFGLDPAIPIEAAMLQQEAAHVAELVEAAWRAGFAAGVVEAAEIAGQAAADPPTESPSPMTRRKT